MLVTLFVTYRCINKYRQDTGKFNAWGGGGVTLRWTGNQFRVNAQNKKYSKSLNAIDTVIASGNEDHLDRRRFVSKSSDYVSKKQIFY